MVDVMVTFVCQLGWTAVPRYMVRHYSECFCEGIYWMRVTLIPMEFQ